MTIYYNVYRYTYVTLNWPNNLTGFRYIITSALSYSWSVINGYTRKSIPSKVNHNLLERICWPRVLSKTFRIRIDRSIMYMYGNIYVHYWFRYYIMRLMNVALIFFCIRRELLIMYYNIIFYNIGSIFSPLIFY